jgi:hypothetical protein
MKIALGSAALLAGLLAATPAMADSAAVLVQSTVQPVCSFSTKPAAVQSIQPVAGEYNLGDLGYTCNFQGNANLTLVLPNGTNFHNPATGATDVGYGLRWLVPPNSSGTGYASFAAGNYPFQWPTAQVPNTETKGALMVKLATNLTVAGTYSTTIAYTITP